MGAGERCLFSLCCRRLGRTRGNGNYTRGLDAVKREKFANKGALTLSCHFYSLCFYILTAIRCDTQGRIQDFFRRGALVSCSTSTPINHIVFFCRIPVVLENRRPSQGGGVRTPCTHPLDLPLILY